MCHQSTTWPASDKAKQFVKDQFAIDSLSAPLVDFMAYPEQWNEYNHRQLEVGITAIGRTASALYYGFNQTCREVHGQLKYIYAEPENFAVVRTAGDIQRVHEAGKLGFLFNSQGSACLENNPDFYMPLIKNMGFGTLHLTYNGRYRAGDGCYLPYEVQGPVSDYGKAVIDACHKNRVIFDTSHASHPTAMTAIEYSHKTAPGVPVIESHTAPSGLFERSVGGKTFPEGRDRSISDERIQAIAATGGTIGIVMLPWLLIRTDAPQTRPTDVVERIDYVKNLVGIDHVALASDDHYDYEVMWSVVAANPDSYDDGGVTQAYVEAGEFATDTAEPGRIYPAIVDEMRNRGYSDEEVAKVLGGNLLRVYEQVWG